MSASRYLALPSSPDNEVDIRDLNKKTGSGKYDRFLLWGLVLWTILLTSSSALVLLHDAKPSTSLRKPLRRPSPFVNPEWLREAARLHNHTYAPIVNNAPLSFQMSVMDRQRKLIEDISRERDTIQGRVWPDDRHILVTNTTSTVVQFRNRDFDMERCTLTLALPRDSHTLVAAQRVYPRSVVRVWMLDNSFEIHPEIFWGNAPARKYELMTLKDLDPFGSALTSAPFRCASTSFTTLELECVPGIINSADCLVDFWQDREPPLAGLYITQHHAAPMNTV